MGGDGHRRPPSRLVPLTGRTARRRPLALSHAVQRFMSVRKLGCLSPLPSPSLPQASCRAERRGHRRSAGRPASRCGCACRRTPPRRSGARGAAADLARRRVAHRREPGRHGPLDEQRPVRRLPRRASGRRAPISHSPAPIRRASLRAEVGAWRVKGADPALLLPGFKTAVQASSTTPLTPGRGDGRRARRSRASAIPASSRAGRSMSGARRHAALRADARACPRRRRRSSKLPR